MADKLIFPIGFDLEEAVKKAGQEWNSTYADKLEKMLAKRAITVNLGFNTRNLNNLDDVKRRLAELKITPLTPENKKAIKDLVRDLKELARIMEKIQKFKGVELPELQMAKAAKLRKDVEQADEKLRLSQERLILSQQRAERQAGRTSKAYETQSGYLDRLIKRMAVYASFRQIGNFLTNVREVTAQFELQRVSLGAIIQDQTRANQLFSEIKAFALKSPVSIMDLTKYTKQLAAYKIGVDELFDTTKRLTDISVGLGVSMDRIVLMYGQIRATGYLRASEVRQATEAGIPLVEELAKKLTDMNGKLVTSADVMEMISKRAISFDLVKEVFDDMTSAGGMFYNMQEKQGNTLFGLWAKLGDAASVMYDEIGNTEKVNGAIKGLIQLATDLMKNWQTVAATVIPAIAAAGGVAIIKKATAIYETFSNRKIKSARRVVSATKALNKAQKAELAATEALNRARAKGSAEDVRAAAAKQTLARANLKAAESEMKAATATGFLAKATRVLGPILSSNIFWMAASAIGGLIVSLVTAKSDAEKLAAALAEVDQKIARKNADDKAKFDSLADEIIHSIDGTDKQKKAIEELGRTFDGVIDKQLLTAEGLRKLNGEYGEFYDLIKLNNEEMRREEKKAAVKQLYSDKLKEMTQDCMDGNEEMLAQISELLIGLEDLARENQLTYVAIGRLFAKTMGVEGDGDYNELGKIVWFGFGGYIDTLEAMYQAMDAVDKEADVNIANLSKYRSEVNELAKSIAEEEFLAPGTRVDVGGDLMGLDDAEKKVLKLLEDVSMFDDEWKELHDKLQEIRDLNIFPDDLKGDEYSQMLYKRNYDMLQVVDMLKAQIADSGVELTREMEATFFHVVDQFDKSTGDVTTIYFDKLIEWARENSYSKLVDSFKSTIKDIVKGISPDSEMVSSAQRRFMELNRGTEAGFKQLRRLLMQNGEDVGTYRKRLADEIKSYQKTLFQLNIMKRWAQLWGKPTEQIVKDIKEATAEMAAAQNMLNDLGGDPNAKGGRESDPRLQTLQEIANKMAEVNKEYDELLKKEGQTKALADTQKLFASSFKQMEATAKKYGFKLPAFEVPQTIEDVQKWYKAIMDNIKRLNLKNADKVLIELGFKSDKAAIDKQQKEIEKQLKELSDRISRTKTAKEFYDKILSTTGDLDLAANVTMSIYGDAGTDVQAQMAEYISQLFGSVELEVPVSIITSEGVIDYTALEKFATENEKILGDSYKELIKIAQDGQKNMAKTYEGYLKDLEVAKTYADKRIELARDTANKINEIERERVAAQRKLDELVLSGKTDKGTQGEVKRLKAMINAYSELPKQYEERESRETAKLEYEAFKDTPLYTQMFEDLDYASTSALTRMRDRLVALKDQWKNLDPTQLKELQNRLEEIDSQLAARNPFKALADAYKQWRDLRKSGRTKKGDELAADTAETERKEAEKKMIADEKAYQAAVKKYGAESDAAEAARKAADASKEEYDNAENAANETAKQANDWKQISDIIDKAAKSLKEYQQAFNDIAGGVRDIMEAFGASSEDMQFFDDMVGGFNKIMDAGEKAASAAINIMSGNPLMIAKGVEQGFSAIGGLVSGFTDLFSAGRVRKANKEIKRQQELLEQLEYTYGRLEKAADKLFGRDYLTNYNQQLKNLQAQQEAYQKQAEAERSKGKKADEEKIKEYENQARETADKIKELQDDLVSQIVGTDVASAARDFANAWLDAYLSFGSTTDAIKEKFDDMIKNMIVNMVLAQVVKRALQPIFDMIDELAKDGELSASDIAKVFAMVPQSMQDINNGLSVGMEALKAAGVDISNLREGSGEFTGIAKSVAGATSEEINNVAAIGNTLMYYVSPIPRIDENLARVLAIMEGRAAALPTASGVTTGAVEYTDLFNTANQHLSSLPRMEQHLSEIHTMLGRALRTKGSVTGFNTFLNP